MKTETTEFKIEKNIPIAGDSQKKSAIIRQMQIGDSIAFPSSDRTKVSSLLTGIRNRYGFKFQVKKVSSDTCRFWRTE